MCVPEALRACFSFLSYSSASLVFPVECNTCVFAEASLKDPGPWKARVPLTTYSRCVNARLSLCRILILFVVPLFFFSCDKRACPRSSWRAEDACLP